MEATSTNINIGLNSVNCIKESNQFTQTVFYNVCTGKQFAVPTGSYDYMLGIPLFIIVVLFVIFIATMIYKLISD